MKSRDGERDRVAQIEQRLTEALTTHDIAVRDDSHLHVGHAGARDGRGHFAVRIVSPDFEGLPRIQRHRKVYAAVQDLMLTDIHALSVTALTPEEANAGA